MSLYIRLHNIISPNNFSLYYKSGESVGNPNSGFTYYNSYTGGTTGLVISGATFSFNTKYWIKIVDDVTKKYIIENIYTHESCFYDCFDVTQTPTPTQTPTIPSTQTQTPTQTPTPTPTKATVDSCVQVSYVLKQVDNLGCGIFDSYYEYTITYKENGIVKPAPEDITFTVTTDKDGSTTYPILLSQGSSTVTDDSVLIRQWDNCEDKVLYDYSVISTGITPTYSLCSTVAVTSTPTPTPTGVGTCIKITDLVVTGTEILGEAYLRIQINLDDKIDKDTEFQIEIITTNIGQINQIIRVNSGYTSNSLMYPMGYTFIPIIEKYCVVQISGSSKINCNNYNCKDIICPCSSG